jgi:hypothetical protein
VGQFRRLALIALFAINGVLCSQHAVGQTLNDLMGLSVHSVVSLQLTLRKPETNDYSRVRYHTERNIYISNKGHLFVYAVDSTGSKPRSGVAEIDKAYRRDSLHPELLFIWTLVNGHLTLVNQFLKGARVYTYIIDPKTLGCALEAHDEPDPVSHTIVDFNASGLFETLSMGFAGSTCTVSRGNIFGSDQ